jgi:hypothetical protein
MDILYIFVISSMQSTNIPRITFHHSEIRRNEVLLIIATDSVATIVTQLACVM